MPECIHKWSPHIYISKENMCKKILEDINDLPYTLKARYHP